MSYLDRIRESNNYHKDRYLPFYIADECLGWTRKAFANLLTRWPDVFLVTPKSVTLHPELKTEEQRSRAISPILRQLRSEGIIDAWVNETYPIVQTFGEPARMHIERASTHHFGIRSFGVHMNGLVKKPDGIYVWTAERSKVRPFWPGKLDQIAAGGQPAGISESAFNYPPQDFWPGVANPGQQR